MTKAKNYAVEETSKGIKLLRNNVESLEIKAEEGLCMANHEDPSKAREIASYYQNVIVPGITNGTISDGSSSPFDDRKMRLHSTSIQGRVLRLQFGISHYGEFKVPFSRTDEENLELQERGTRELGDKYAFFPRNPGIAAIVLTSDRSIFLGEKIDGDDAGQLTTVAGHLQYENDPKKVNLIDNLNRELGEFGVLPENVFSKIFVGGYLNPIRGDMDFTYIVFTNLRDNFFSSGDWRDRSTEKEHRNLVRLASFSEVQHLLSTNALLSSTRMWEIGYSTRGALESIKKSEMD